MSILLADLEAASRRIASTSARLEKVAVLAELLGRLAPGEVRAAVALQSGGTRQGRTGLGPAAVREAAAVPHAASPSLTLAEVDAAFERIAALTGPGSVKERVRVLADLFRRATTDEVGYLVRVLMGELRQGALEGLMEDALARASGIPGAELRRAIMMAGDLPTIAEVALGEGRPGLARFRLELFRPVLPMLAQTADAVAGALERLGEAALEYKLDGARVQVHKSGDEVRAFSRLLNDVTPAVPELVEAVRALPARELVLDGEVVALRPDGAPHPFQVTMRRFGRRLDVAGLRAELPLTPFFFDVLRIDGDDLLDAPARERFARLAATAGPLAVPRLVTTDAAEAEAFFDRALEDGHEGVMAKDPAASYAAGSRGSAWLKVKPAHTLDLVVLAAEWGHGRRKGWLSNLHLGARDAATGGFHMIGKTFKGMTDAMLAWQTERLQSLAVASDTYTVHVRPELVVEVAFSDAQASTNYASGIALRFARVKRYREDKRPGDADTIQTVRAILDGTIRKSRVRPVR